MLRYPLFNDVPLEQGQAYGVIATHEGPANDFVINTSKSENSIHAVVRFASADNWSRIIGGVPKTKLVLTEEGITVNTNEIEKNIAKVSNFPNPFTSNLEIQYTLNQNALVQFELFDITGKQILLLNEGNREAGIVNSINLNGNNLNSGVYFYTLTINGERITKKLIKQ